MATENSPTAELADVAHVQSNKLFDVLALLKGARGFLAEIEPKSGADETTDFILRLLWRADEDVRGVITALDPHI